MTGYSRLISGLVAVELALTLIGRGLVIAIEVSVRQVTFHADISNHEEMSYLSEIVDALENLGVLESNPRTCYSLDRIVKVQETVENGWKVNIEFQIKEIRELDGVIKDLRDATGPCVGQEIPTYANPTSGTVHSTAHLGTSQQDDLPGRDRVSLDQSGNYTTDTASVKQTDDSTLSLAQITVISSCSIVIGLFFIVALIMRIRNCVKRRKQLKDKRRTAYHSPSVKVGNQHNVTASTSNNVRTHHPHINMTEIMMQT